MWYLQTHAIHVHALCVFVCRYHTSWQLIYTTCLQIRVRVAGSGGKLAHVTRGLWFGCIGLGNGWFVVTFEIKSKIQEAKISEEHSDPHPTLIKVYQKLGMVCLHISMFAMVWYVKTFSPQFNESFVTSAPNVLVVMWVMFVEGRWQKTSAKEFV